MRLSGSDNIDTTIPKKNVQELLDSIDLYINYLNSIK